MAAMKRRTPAKRKTTAVRRTTRRRKTMGQPFSKTALKSGGRVIMRGAAGGAVAKLLADNVAGALQPILGSTLAPYSRPITAALGAYLTETMVKNRDLALGMAGAAGAELAGSLTGAIGLSDMYSTDAMQLSGYEVPMNDMGMGENIYASSYANNLY
jgi:hypothetical protein